MTPALFMLYKIVIIRVWKKCRRYFNLKFRIAFDLGLTSIIEHWRQALPIWVWHFSTTIFFIQFFYSIFKKHFWKKMLKKHFFHL